MLRPRQYQWDAIVSIWKFFEEGNTGNPLVAMPTGTGKSIVIGGFVRSIYDHYPNQRIMILTHVKELIQQNYNKLMDIWPQAPAGIYSSGLNRRDVFNNILFAGIASVAKRPELFGRIDLILIDEAHLVSPNDSTMYQKFIEALRQVNPHLRVIGLTATPYRLGHGLITEGNLFTDICYDITSLHEFNKLIAEGYLAPLIPFRTSLKLNVDGIHMRGGEYIQKELQNAVDKEEITYAALKEALNVGHDRKCWLIFASGVEHAIHISEMLNELGVPCGVVHSGNKERKMSSSERDQVIADYKAGKLRALVNNNVLTTGFDHPQIDLILSLRPTASPGLWVQILGRGTRPVYAPGFDLSTTEGRLQAIQAGGKHNCLVLDFAGNTRRLGPINDPVIPKKPGKKGGTAPVKECDRCPTINHASVRFCISCGYEFPIQTKLKQAASTEELIKGDLPKIEEFKVDHITYALHKKQDKPPSMKVSYHCGRRVFTEYVCFEHDGFARRKAQKWWAERTKCPFPENTAKGLELSAGQLQTATSLRVWVNKPYPEIMAQCFDGTHFGKEEAAEARPTVENTADAPGEIASFVKKIQEQQGQALDFEDDIPF